MSSAELVYGAPLMLPGHVLGVPEPPAATFNEQVRAAPRCLPTRQLPSSSAVPLQEIPQHLREAAFVYVSRGSSKPPLTPAYRRAICCCLPFPQILYPGLRGLRGVSQRRPAKTTCWSFGIHPSRGSLPWSRPPLSSLASPGPPPGGGGG